MDEQSNLPAPLLGCLYCHAEGTIIQTEGRKRLGFIGGNFPQLNCTQCGAVASFDLAPDGNHWRIRYQKYNREHLYHFAAQRLGKAGWLEEKTALEQSRLIYIQRHRLQQAEQNNLQWLRPIVLNPPPPVIGLHQTIHLNFRYVTYRQLRSTYRFAHNEADPILDAGSLYITDSHLHLLGKEDRSYKIETIHATNFNHKAWFIYFEKKDRSVEYLQCNGKSEEIDPQLAVAVVEALRRKNKSP